MGLGGDSTRRVVVQFVAEDNNVGTTVTHLDGSVRDLKGRFVSLEGATDAFGRTVKRAGNQGQKAMGGIKGSLRSAQGAIRGAVKSGKAFADGLKNIGLLGLGFSTVVDGAVAAAEAIDKLATESLELQQVSQNLAFGIEAAAEATGGFVDNMTLARNANKAFALGVAQDSQEFAALAGSAQKIAQAQGVSAQKLVEQAVVGIGRKSAARLDDLGILLNQTKAERIYAKSLGKTAKELTLLEKEEAFQKAALIEIQKAGDRASASIDGFAVTVAKGQIELENAKQGMLGFDDTLGKVRESLRGLSDEELDRLRFGEMADDTSRLGRELNKTLDEFGTNLFELRGAADDLGVSYLELIKGQQELREVTGVEDTIKGLETLNQIQIQGMLDQAGEAEHLAELTEAEGGSQKLVNLRILEGLELRRDAAQLQAMQTESAADEAKVLALSRQIELASAKKRGGGGKGPSAADRVAAAGEARVANLEHVASLMETIAETADQITDAEEASRTAALARIDLEIDVLEATKARGRVAQLERDNEITALQREAGLLTLEGRADARAREAAELAEVFDIAVQLETIEVNEAARVISLESFRLTAKERQLTQGGQLAAASQVRLTLLAAEAQAEQLVFDQREADILNHPPETQLEELRQREELRQLHHERELARMQAETDAGKERDAESDRLAKAEDDRKKKSFKLAQEIANAGKGILDKGFAFASLISKASIKDDEKRARHNMRIEGLRSLATGAVEAVNAAASYASLKIPQGILHTAASGFAFATGAALLSGRIPTGGASAGGAPASEPQAVDRDKTAAATTVESVPAADRQPGLRQGQPGQGQGGNVFNIGSINAMGSIDDDFAENLAIKLGNVGNGLEQTG